MSSRSIRTGLHTAAALAAGLLLRLWFIAHIASISGDTVIYGNIAKNLLQHHVYGFHTTPSGVQPTLIRLPGYPLFLAACFALFGIERYTAVMVIQALFDLLTCLLIAALAGRLFGPRARIAALWLACLCPFTATYVAAPLTEVLTLTSIALAFYCLERWQRAGANLNRWLWGTGFAMACSLLLRPEQGLLAAAIVPAILYLSWHSQNYENRHLDRSTGQFHRPVRSGEIPASRLDPHSRPLSHPNKASLTDSSSLRLLAAILPALLASLCVLLPLAPWTARNWHTFHVFQPLAPRSATDPGEDIPSGFDHWFRTWGIDYASTEEVYWNYDNAEIDIGDLPTRAFDSRQQYAQTSALLADYNRNSNATPALNVRFQAIADQRIHADPLRYYLALPIARLLNMAFRPRVELMAIPLDWWRAREHPGKTIEALALAALNLAYFILGAAGLALWYRHGWHIHAPLAWSLVAFVLLRCALLLTLDNSETRYTLELFPILILWASFLFRTQPAP